MGLLTLMTFASLIFEFILITSSMVGSSAEDAKRCEVATTKAECTGLGCTFDCQEKKCFPMEYVCMSQVSSRCFPLCNDKAACEAEQDCTYDETTESCTGPSEEVSQRASGKRWLMNSKCEIICDDTILNIINGHCLIKPSQEELCAGAFKDSGCCDLLLEQTTPYPTQPEAEEPRLFIDEMPLPPPPVERAALNALPRSAQASITTTTTTTLGPTTMDPSAPTTPDSTRNHCKSFDKDVYQCRKEPECAYSCGDSKCVKKMDIPDECSNGCAQFCHDSCGCKAAAGGKCEYSVATGKCLPRQAECPEELFSDNECRRAKHYYAAGGVLCYNSKEIGNCDVVSNIESVNLNGRRHTDYRGIDYKSDDEVYYRDKYNARRKFYFSQSKLNEANGDDYLFKGVVSALGIGMEEGQCLIYGLETTKIGSYELTIKTFEPFAKRLHQRMFNIQMHGQVVVPDLDIFALVGGKDRVLSIVVNFNVTWDNSNKRREFTAKGHAPVEFDVLIYLGFCVGECRKDDRFFWEIGNYLVSAFSVVKIA